MIKKSILRGSVLALALFMMLNMSITTFATPMDEVFSSNIDSKYENFGISPTSYVDPDSFTFTTYNGGLTRSMDSRYLAYECTVTNSNSPYVEILTYIDGVAVRRDRISSSGKVDWIDMGYSGTHKVKFSYWTAEEGQHATVKMKFYSWN